MTVAESPYRWVIVALGGLMGCVSIGAMFSLAVFLAPMSDETQWSRAGVSAAMTINFLVLAFGSFGWGAASDRWGARVGTVFGAATMLSALGMSIGPLFGGWVFDTFHNYAWLYIASAAVAVGAVMLALLFPKPSHPVPA